MNGNNKSTNIKTEGILKKKDEASEKHKKSNEKSTNIINDKPSKRNLKSNNKDYPEETITKEISKNHLLNSHSPLAARKQFTFKNPPEYHLSNSNIKNNSNFNNFGGGTNNIEINDNIECSQINNSNYPFLENTNKTLDLLNAFVFDKIKSKTSVLRIHKNTLDENENSEENNNKNSTNKNFFHTTENLIINHSSASESISNEMNASREYIQEESRNIQRKNKKNEQMKAKRLGFEFFESGSSIKKSSKKLLTNKNKHVNIQPIPLEQQQQQRDQSIFQSMEINLNSVKNEDNNQSQNSILKNASNPSLDRFTSESTSSSVSRVRSTTFGRLINVLFRFFFYDYYGVLLFHLIILLDSLIYIIKTNNSNAKTREALNIVDKIFLVCYCFEPLLIILHYGPTKLVKKTLPSKPKLSISLIWFIILLMEYFHPILGFCRLFRYLRLFYILNLIEPTKTIIIILIGHLKEYTGIILSIIYIMLLASVFFTIIYSAGNFGICTYSKGPYQGKINDIPFHLYGEITLKELNNNTMMALSGLNSTGNAQAQASTHRRMLSPKSNNNANSNTTNQTNTDVLTFAENSSLWNQRKFLFEKFTNNICRVGSSELCPVNHYCSDLSESYEYFFLESMDLNNIKYYSSYISGENIGKSFFYSFLVGNLDGWSLFFNQSVEVLSPTLVFMHWFFIVLIINIILLKFPIGIMVNAGITNDSINNKKEKIREAILAEIQESLGNMDNESNYFEVEFRVFEKLQNILSLIKQFQFLKRIEPYYEFHRKWNASFICFYIIKQPLTNIILSVIATMNLFFLAFETDLKGNSISLTIKILILAIFSLNIIFVSLGELHYIFKNKEFFYDLVILILSVIEMAVSKTIFVSALYSFRAISFLFFLKELKTLGVAYRIILQTSMEIYKYCIVLFFFLYYFMIFGQFLYKDNLKYITYNSYDQVVDQSIIYSMNTNSQPKFYYRQFDLNRGVSPILNFDGVYESFLTVFNLFIGDSWEQIFKDAYYSPLVNFTYTYLYFILSIFIMKVWLANLALAIWIFQFEKSRKTNMFLKILYEFTQKQRQLRMKRTNSFSFKSKIELRKFVINNDSDGELDDTGIDAEEEITTSNNNILLNKTRKSNKPTKSMSESRLKQVYYESPLLNKNNNKNSSNKVVSNGKIINAKSSVKKRSSTLNNNFVVNNNNNNNNNNNSSNKRSKDKSSNNDHSPSNFDLNKSRQNKSKLSCDDHNRRKSSSNNKSPSNSDSKSSSVTYSSRLSNAERRDIKLKTLKSKTKKEDIFDNIGLNLIKRKQTMQAEKSQQKTNRVTNKSANSNSRNNSIVNYSIQMSCSPLKFAQMHRDFRDRDINNYSYNNNSLMVVKNKANSKNSFGGYYNRTKKDDNQRSNSIIRLSQQSSEKQFPTNDSMKLGSLLKNAFSESIPKAMKPNNNNAFITSDKGINTNDQMNFLEKYCKPQNTPQVNNPGTEVNSNSNDLWEPRKSKDDVTKSTKSKKRKLRFSNMIDMLYSVPSLKTIENNDNYNNKNSHRCSIFNTPDMQKLTLIKPKNDKQDKHTSRQSFNHSLQRSLENNNPEQSINLQKSPFTGNLRGTDSRISLINIKSLIGRNNNNTRNISKLVKPGIGNKLFPIKTIEKGGKPNSIEENNNIINNTNSPSIEKIIRDKDSIGKQFSEVGSNALSNKSNDIGKYPNTRKFNKLNLDYNKQMSNGYLKVETTEVLSFLHSSNNNNNRNNNKQQVSSSLKMLFHPKANSKNPNFPSNKDPLKQSRGSIPAFENPLIQNISPIFNYSSIPYQTTNNKYQLQESEVSSSNNFMSNKSSNKNPFSIKSKVSSTISVLPKNNSNSILKPTDLNVINECFERGEKKDSLVSYEAVNEINLNLEKEKKNNNNNQKAFCEQEHFESSIKTPYIRKTDQQSTSEGQLNQLNDYNNKDNIFNKIDFNNNSNFEDLNDIYQDLQVETQEKPQERQEKRHSMNIKAKARRSQSSSKEDSPDIRLKTKPYNEFIVNLTSRDNTDLTHNKNSVVKEHLSQKKDIKELVEDLKRTRNRNWNLAPSRQRTLSKVNLSNKPGLKVFNAVKLRRINSDNVYNRLNIVVESAEEDRAMDNSDFSNSQSKKNIPYNNYIRFSTIRSINEVQSSNLLSKQHPSKKASKGTSNKISNKKLIASLKNSTMKANLSVLEHNAAQKFSKINSKLNSTRRLKFIKEQGKNPFAWPDYYSVLLFHRDSYFRSLMVMIFTYKHTDNIILIAIFLNIVLLIIETPYVHPWSNLHTILLYCDNFLSVFFFVEMIMRIIGFGLYFDYKENISDLICFKYCKGKVKLTTADFFAGKSNITVSRKSSKKSASNALKTTSKVVNPNTGLINSFSSIPDYNDCENAFTNACGKLERAHLRDILSIIDTVVNFYAIILFYFSVKSSSSQFLSELKSFKAFIALRPLVMIKRNKVLKKLVNAISKAIPMIFNVFVIILYICTILGIIGHNFFYGRLGSCTNPQFTFLTDCQEHGFTWTQAEYNYDRVPSVDLILFELAFKEDWFTIVYNTLIKTPYFKLYSVYFIVIMIICGVFLINLAYAVIIDSFKQTIEQSISKYQITSKFEKNFFFALEHFAFHQPKKLLLIERNHSKVFLYIYLLHKKKTVQYISLVLNVLNCAIHIATYSGQPDSITKAQMIVFIVHMIVAIILILIKIYLYGYKYYFTQTNYLLDVIVILLILVFSLMSNFIDNEMTKALLIFTRLLYCYKLIKLSNSLKHVIAIIRKMVPKLLGIMFLLFTFLVIFTTVAMSYFGKAKQSEFINNSDNFSNFPHSAMLLLKCLVGGKWNRIMRELGTALPNCMTEQSYEDLFVYGPQTCGDYKSWLFFAFYMVICRIIILMLFIAVFVEYFISRKEKNQFINSQDVKEFYSLWSKYDPSLNYEIPCDQFVLFCLQLGKPFDGIFKVFEVKSPQILGNFIVSPDNNLIIELSTLLKMSYFLNGVKVTSKKTVHLGSAIEYLIFKLIIGDLTNFKYNKVEDCASENFLKNARKMLNKNLFKGKKLRKNDSNDRILGKRETGGLLHHSVNQTYNNNSLFCNNGFTQFDRKANLNCTLVEFLAEDILRKDLAEIFRKRKLKKTATTKGVTIPRIENSKEGNEEEKVK